MHTPVSGIHFALMFMQLEVLQETKITLNNVLNHMIPAACTFKQDVFLFFITSHCCSMIQMVRDQDSSTILLITNHMLPTFSLSDSHIFPQCSKVGVGNGTQPTVSPSVLPCI